MAAAAIARQAAARSCTAVVAPLVCWRNTGGFHFRGTFRVGTHLDREWRPSRSCALRAAFSAHLRDRLRPRAHFCKP
eukprot:2523452-Prymnesium_polylepis.1